MTIKSNEILPAWVQYVAQDADGKWYAYADKPVANYPRECWESIGPAEQLTGWANSDDWKTSLAPRTVMPAQSSEEPPEWAKFVATDKDGRKHWFANHPGRCSDVVSVELVTPPAAGNAFEGAPAWANYRATDFNGAMHWYEKEPKINSRYPTVWVNQKGTRQESCNNEGASCANWKDSLIVRDPVDGYAAEGFISRNEAIDLFGPEPDQSQADFRITLSREQLARFIVKHLAYTLGGDEYRTDLQLDWDDAGGVSVAVRYVD